MLTKDSDEFSIIGWIRPDFNKGSQVLTIISKQDSFKMFLTNEWYWFPEAIDKPTCKKIKDLGHHIGLHQNPPLMEIEKLGNYIITDIHLLEHFYGFEIDRFAFHRPKKEFLASYINLKDKINCYGKNFSKHMNSL